MRIHIVLFKMTLDWVLTIDPHAMAWALNLPCIAYSLGDYNMGLYISRNEPERGRNEPGTRLNC